MKVLERLGVRMERRMQLKVLLRRLLLPKRECGVQTLDSVRALALVQRKL